jgi:tetratricopeptide (TPR) repeat protein
MDSLTKKPARKRLNELLVEAGIVKPEELPKGLEYAQKATDADVQAVQQVKELINEQGLSVPTALRALTLAKQKHCDLQTALLELGWRPRKPEGFVEPEKQTGERQIKSSFNPAELDQIGSDKPGPTYATDLQRNTWTGMKALTTKEHEISQNFLKGEGEESGAASQAPNAVPNTTSPSAAAQNPSAPNTVPPIPTGPPRLTMPPDPPAQTAPAQDDDWSLRDDRIQALRDPDMESTFAPDGESGIWEETTEMEAFSPEFVDSMRNGDLAFGEHRYLNAEEQYLIALGVLEKSLFNKDTEIANLLVKMGRATLQISEFGRAEAYLCRALKIREISLGREDILVAECLDFLAELYDLQSQYLEAEQYYLGALGIKERVLNPDNSEVSRSLKKLVAVSKRRGVSTAEEKKSGELLTEAGLVDPARLQEGLAVAQDRELPIGRALISLNYLTDQDLEAVLQAQLLLREGIIPGYLAVRALRLASQQRITLERALREIGLEPDDGNYQGVFALLRAAHELLNAERQLAPEDPGLASLCVKVGDVYTDHHQYPQAEQLYRRALSIRERQEDIDQKEIAEILARIGDLQFRQQRYDEAQDIYVKLLDTWEIIAGPDDINFVNCLESLAAVHYVKTDFRESGRLYQLAVSGKEKLLGKEHPAVASAVQGRANCYYAVQRYPEAEKLYRRAMEMYEKVYGPNNEQVGILLNVLGDLFYSQNDYEKAQEEYAKGLNALSNCNNPDIWTFTNMLEKSAHCFAEMNDLERADAYYRHLIKTREGFGTFHSPDMPDALERYAIVLDRLGRADDAAAMRQHADSTRQFCARQ